MARISGVCAVVDEEVSTLPSAIKSASAFADEIVIVDMTSVGLAGIVRAHKNVKLYKHRKVSHVELVRNFSIGKATGDWIFIFDPDEEVSEALARKVRDVSDKPQVDYFRLPRKNIVFGKWMQYSRWWPDYNVRLFKKGMVRWTDAIHTVPQTSGSGQDLPAEEELAIIHHNYDSIDQYLGRMNRYTAIQAQMRIRSGYKFEWSDLLTKPATEFFSRYFAANGFKDGLHGLVLATLQAFSEFVVYLKVWEVAKFPQASIPLQTVLQKGREVGQDLNYWKANALLSEKSSVILRIKRKLRLP